jgi:hypothetical protein
VGNTEEGLESLATLARMRDGKLELVALRSVDKAALRGDRFAPGARVRDPVTGQEGVVVGTSYEHVLSSAPGRTDGPGGVAPAPERGPGPAGRVGASHSSTSAEGG